MGFLNEDMGLGQKGFHKAIIVGGFEVWSLVVLCICLISRG